MYFESLISLNFRILFLSKWSIVNILQGDFNIDAFDIDPSVKRHDILSNYRFLVKEPTHLDGALLDHVYLYKLFLSKNVNAFAKGIYFSDYDAAKWQILFRENDDIHFEGTM